HPSPGATADSEAWERLWARSQLVLHVEGQVLTCSLSAPCDLSAELVPCWQPKLAGPCQALPGLQQPSVGQGPQEFVGLRLHPNLCIQVGRSPAPHGCPLPVTSPGPLPGRADDLLLLQHGGNASLCALERGSCTPLASFTSTVRGSDPRVLVVVVPVAQLGHCLLPLQGAGHPGLLEQELRRDMLSGQCRQIWHLENSTGITFWACPLHKYLHARWALVWMGVLLGSVCLLLLLLLKKEDMKG
ncbi:I17RC protein, partial [Nycticryphes semicollaris]|nr:I17RC protein [Nycticryphes semicollaris]